MESTKQNAIVFFSSRTRHMFFNFIFIKKVLCAFLIKNDGERILPRLSQICEETYVKIVNFLRYAVSSTILIKK